MPQARRSAVNRRSLIGAGGGILAAALLPASRRSAEAISISPAALADATDRFVRTALQTYDVPGAAVAVVLNDEVVLARGYGLRRLGAPGQVDEHTIFQLGSNTKLFTAATLGTLVDEGAIGWDDAVIDHLPAFALHDPYPTRYATVRDLLAHRTGLPAFAGDLLGDLGFDRAEVLRRIRFIELASSFREVAHYSNIGYFAAGELAASVSGRSWEVAVQERVLDPLGLARTSPTDEVDQDGANVASNHALIDGALQPIPWYEQNVLAAAGTLTSTAADMAQWIRALLAGGTLDGRRVLAAETVEELFAPSMIAPDSFSEMPPIDERSGFAYGLGCGVFRDHGEIVIEKGGGLSGVRSVLNLVPERRLGIVVLSNRDLLPLPEAVRAFVLSQVLGYDDAANQQEIRKRTAMLEDLLKPVAPPADAAPPALPLAGYAGTYESPLYGRFDVVTDGDAIRIEAGTTRFPGTLSHFGRDTFQLSWPPVDYGNQLITFVPAANGTASSFQTESLGNFTRGS
jgi:CubicO group peptidase (beta-lactamase class C family)